HPKHSMTDHDRYVVHYSPSIPSLKCTHLLSLLASKDHKVVAVALLGADVTVVDSPSSKAKYANEFADPAGVSIAYVVSDVLHVQLSESFDIVLLELGVLHYFLDLKQLFQKIANLLKQDGTLNLRDSHPVYPKLLAVRQQSFRAKGNDFDEDLVEVVFAYRILLTYCTLYTSAAHNALP
ncbi:bifunctional 2-polyprenyl-6-hydroxyphenol methylase/3-demethylubiquinol 3-O-methyltransferase UbiG, partial [Bacillus sp. S1-R5C1-FB]|uniref:class I SAM-dependent methyltransferase n=1 Tax=Bacillus sp. S1-R5C1-FB TaxID=1973491 RepID=UPI0011551838